MTRFALAFASAVLFLSVASQALAGDKVWSVPGVTNDGSHVRTEVLHRHLSR
jgi:hypothetical protein